MKRLLSWILVCMLCLGLIGSAGAEDFLLKTDYETITETYKLAIRAQEEMGDVEEAISGLRELISYYETMAQPGIKQYEDARVYYSYALARVELIKENPDYSYVLSELRSCDETFFMAAAYRQYAKGMAAMENKDYADALSNLQGVVLKEFTSQRLNAIEECRKLYKEETVTNGKKACSSGNHQLAQEYYSKYLEVIDDDIEIKRLLDECKNTHTEDGPVDPVLEIINAVTSIPRSMKLSWKGNGDKYTVTWASDLVRGKDAKTQEVEDKTLTIEDLLPGTVYRVTIDYQGFNVQIDRETRKAEDYVPAGGSGRFWSGSSSMFRFNESRYTFLDSGKTSFEFANDKSCKYLKNRTVELFDNPISESCILFVFTTFGVPEEISGKPYQLLLHIDGVATLLDAGTFGDAKVCASGSNIFVLTYDLFDQAVEDYSDLSGKAFRLDLLVDDKFVASADGVLQ